MKPPDDKMKHPTKPSPAGHRPGPEGRSFKAPAIPSAFDQSRLDDDLDDLDDALDFDADGVPFEPAPVITPSADATPNPVELPAPINPEGGKKQSVEMHRNLFCAHYDACLDEAVKRGWNSFTCLRCAFYHTGREDGSVERFATQRRLS